MSTGELIFIIVLGWFVMGFLTCLMRAHISHVDGFEAGSVTLVFWFWPIWFVWVLPTWLHEHIIGRKTEKTNWE